MFGYPNEYKGDFMPTVVHCEGEPCPKPVLRCKQVLSDKSVCAVQVIVDNEAARENVSRFLVSQHWQVDHVTQDGATWIIAAHAEGAESAVTSEQARQAAPVCPVCPQQVLVFLTSDRIGQGDDELGARLMHNFLLTLPELGSALWRIILVNGAVRLATQDSPACESLQRLEAAGVSILVCGTCLEFFQLMGQKAVGQVTNMLDVVTSQQVADKVISI